MPYVSIYNYNIIAYETYLYIKYPNPIWRFIVRLNQNPRIASYSYSYSNYIFVTSSIQQVSNLELENGSLP